MAGDNRVNPAADPKAADKKKAQEKQRKKAAAANLHDGKNKPNNQKKSWWQRISSKHKEGDDDDEITEIARDIAQTPCETWVTFTFTFLVGSFLLGGGIYLIYNGANNNVVDFVVLGGCGILMGICFTSVGSYLIFRPVYDTYKSRKQKQQEYRERVQAEKSKLRPLPAYFTEDEASRMTRELGEQLSNRRPSNVELYGDNAAATTAGSPSGPRIDSSSSYEPPPQLAVPYYDVNADSRDKPVLLMDVRSKTEDDIMVISEAADKKNVASGPKEAVITKTDNRAAANDTSPSIQQASADKNQRSSTSKENSKQATPKIVELAANKESTNVSVVEVHEPPAITIVPNTSRHSPPVHHGSDASDSPLPIVESPSEDLNIGSRKSTFYLDSGSRPDTGMGDSVSDEDVPARKKRILSAVNERKSAKSRERAIAADTDTANLVDDD